MYSRNMYLVRARLYIFEFFVIQCVTPGRLRPHAAPARGDFNAWRFVRQSEFFSGTWNKKKVFVVRQLVSVLHHNADE